MTIISAEIKKKLTPAQNFFQVRFKWPEKMLGIELKVYAN